MKNIFRKIYLECIFNTFYVNTKIIQYFLTFIYNWVTFSDKDLCNRIFNPKLVIFNCPSNFFYKLLFTQKLYSFNCVSVF